MNELIIEIQKIKHGNFQDYERFYSITSNYIYKIITDIVPDENTASQIMLTTYNRIYETINTLQDDNFFFMWAGRIATEECIKNSDLNREASYGFETSGEHFPYANVYEDNEAFIPEGVLNNFDIQRVIQNTIDAMPIKCKVVLQCFYYQGMSVGEIADKLNMSQQQVRDILGYIRHTFKDIVNQMPTNNNDRLYSFAQIPVLWIIFKNVVDYATTGTIGGIAAGGVVAGGMASGGTAGGMASGGTVAGGMATGGTVAGGTATGGTVAGGVSTGGAVAGGVATTGTVAGTAGTSFLATLGGKIAIGVATTAVLAVGGVAIHNVVTEDNTRNKHEKATETDATTVEETTETVSATPTDVVEEEVVAVYKGTDEIYKIDTNVVYTKDDRTTLFDGYCENIYLESEAYPVLADNVNVLSADIYAEYYETASSFIESAISMESTGWDYGTSIYTNVSVKRADDKVFSLLSRDDAYNGGPHGYIYMRGYSFDVETGAQLKLSDLGDVKEDLKVYLNNYFYENIPDAEYLTLGNIPELVDSETLCWYLLDDGMQVIFNQYEIGPYAAGIFSVKVPYNALPGMNEKYTHGIGICALGDSIDIDGDGIQESVEISMYSSYGDYESGYTGMDVIVDGQSYTVSGLAPYNMTSKYTYKTTDSTCYLVVSTNLSGNSPNIALCKLTKTGVEVVQQLKGCEVAYGVGDILHVTTNIEILGNYSAEKLCRIENNQLVFLEDRYLLRNSENNPDRQSVVTKEAVPVKLEQEGVLVDAELQAGTRIYPINTDAETVVGFYLEDGSYGEVYFEVTGNVNMFNGKTQSEVFD